MAAVLAGNTQIVTSLPPLRTVRRNALPTHPREGDEMGELVEEGVAQLGFARLSGQILEARIQFDAPLPREGPSRCGAHPGIPRDGYRLREGLESEVAGKLGGDEG